MVVGESARLAFDRSAAHYATAQALRKTIARVGLAERGTRADVLAAMVEDGPDDWADFIAWLDGPECAGSFAGVRRLADEAAELATAKETP